MSQGEITKSFLTFALKIPLSTIRENTAVFWWYFPVRVCLLSITLLLQDDYRHVSLSVPSLIRYKLNTF